MIKAGTILYAEDESNDILLFEIAFHRAGLIQTLKTVRDGEQALNYLAGRAAFANRAHYPLPCLILLDINMPKKSGFEVLEWIRRQPPLQSLTVLMFTSSEHSDDMEKAHRLGADDYLLKPSAPSELVELIKLIDQRWLSNRPLVLSGVPINPEIRHRIPPYS